MDTQHPKKGSKKGIIVTVLLAVLVIGGGAAAYYGGNAGWFSGNAFKITTTTKNKDIATKTDPKIATTENNLGTVSPDLNVAPLKTGALSTTETTQTPTPTGNESAPTLPPPMQINVEGINLLPAGYGVNLPYAPNSAAYGSVSKSAGTVPILMFKISVTGGNPGDYYKMGSFKYTETGCKGTGVNELRRYNMGNHNSVANDVPILEYFNSDDWKTENSPYFNPGFLIIKTGETKYFALMDGGFEACGIGSTTRTSISQMLFGMSTSQTSTKEVVAADILNNEGAIQWKQ
jgi:hypothetical protein